MSALSEARDHLSNALHSVAGPLHRGETIRKEHVHGVIGRLEQLLPHLPGERPQADTDTTSMLLAEARGEIAKLNEQLGAKDEEIAKLQAALAAGVPAGGLAGTLRDALVPAGTAALGNAATMSSETSGQLDQSPPSDGTAAKGVPSETTETDPEPSETAATPGTTKPVTSATAAEGDAA